MPKTIIVTGGCGYIGSHVARAFKRDDPQNRVHVIDRVKRDHTLKDIDGYLIDDFASDESLATIISLQPDVIVHCAGTSLVAPSMTDPGEYYENNISKTVRLLNVLRNLQKKPYILFSSSASVYGEPESVPIAEDAEIQPISPYGATKAMTERILTDYAAAYGICSVCFRYFNAAGAEPFAHDLGQEPGATHIVARVLEASINKTDFTLYGNDYDTEDGSCIRDYVHVWDLAIAHLKGVEYLDNLYQDSLDVTAGCYVFNLGTNTGISNWEIVKYVCNKYGLDSLLVQSRRHGDPAVLIANANKASVELYWEPKYSQMETIIDTAYKWYTSGIR